MLPFGKTSLFDAIAETGRRVALMGGTRRAVVALTDGADNASSMSPAEVSALASAIDVPVYVVLIVPPQDQTGSPEHLEERLTAELRGRLGNLARWTGGAIFAATGPAQASLAARQIVNELRHQYLIAFEPGDRPGWHPIEVRTTRKDVVVRTRSGYVVEARPDSR
jgi:VWFA-related protein